MAAYSNYELQPLSYYNGYFFGCLHNIVSLLFTPLLPTAFWRALGYTRCKTLKQALHFTRLHKPSGS